MCLLESLVACIRDNLDGPPPWQEYVETAVRVRLYDGRLPCNLFVVDESVLFVQD